MKILLAGMATAALALGACGGDVVVDPPGATSGGTTTTTTTPITTTTPTATTTLTNCAAGCQAALNQGGEPCDPTVKATFDQVVTCACAGAGPCQTSCIANLCLHQQISQPCEACVSMVCSGPYNLCTEQ